MRINKRPNFFVIGAPKAGTTTLYRRLREHPDVFMPALKEPRFFSNHKNDKLPRDIDEYMSLFEGVNIESAIGEASPNYLAAPEAPSQIAQFNSKARIIAILRHPVERAYSHYCMICNSGVRGPREKFEALFEEALKCAAQGKPAPYGSGYYQSWYADGLQRFYSCFPKSQMFVTTYEVLKADPEGLLRRLFSFLEVDATIKVINASKRENIGFGPPRHYWLHDVVFGGGIIKSIAKRAIPHRLRRRGIALVQHYNKTNKEQLDPDILSRFTSVFYDDIYRTQQIAGLDLSGWLR